MGGEFVLNHERVPLDLDLPDFRGRLEGRPEGGIAGHVSFGPGQLKMGSAPELPVGTEIDVVVHQGVVDVQGARLVAEKTNLTYHGRIRLAGRPQGQLSLEGPVDLAVLEKHVFRSGLGFEGAARWDGLLSIDGSRLRIEGRMEGTGGAFMGVAVPRFAGWLSYDGTAGLVMRDLDVDALGGGARLAVDVPPAATHRPVHIRGPVREADGEGLLRMIFGWGEMRLGTAATGEVDVSWPRGKTRLVSGRIGVDLAERADGRFPLSGRLDWRAEDGRQTYERAEMRGPGMSGRVSGEVDAEDRARLEVEGTTEDLEAAEVVFTRVRRALGNPEAQAAGFTGAGTFRGLWRGTVDWPIFEGRFEGESVGYGGVDWGRAEWAGLLDTAAEAVESRPLVLRKGAGEIRWEGRAEIGWFGLKDAIEGRARASSWPVADLVTFMEWDVVATGLVTGDAQIRGRRSVPEGEAKGTALGGRYYAIPYDRARIESRWKGRLAEVTRGEVRLGGGTVAFRGSVTDDGVYDGSGEMEGVDLGALAPAPVPGAAFGGRLSGRLEMQGTLTRPRLRASLSSPRLFLGDEGIGALEARLVGTGDGRVAVDGRCRSARVDLALAGAVGAAPPYAAELTLSARSTSLDPFLRAVQPALPATLALVASGEVLLRGPLETPAEIRAEAVVPDLQLLLPEFPLRAREPVRLTFSGGRLELADFHLAGEGTDLAVTGGVDVLGEGPLAVSARGQADLRALSLVTRRLRGMGAARLAVDVSGTRAAPRVLGTLDLEGAGLRVRGFPHGVEGLRGRVRFTERAAELEGVNGTLAGGRLTIEGQAAYPGGRLTSYDIRPTGRGLALRYPEGLRSLLDAELRLFGDAGKQWITGTVDVRQALYTKRYDVASELLGARRVLPLPEAASLEEGAQLDLRVRAPGTVRIDNNLATLAASADLAIQGTTRAPVVTGRAEIERGRLFFQGRTYVIQRGALDFVEPPAARPALRHRGRDPHPVLPGDPARLRHPRARHPHAHLRPAALVAPDPRPSRRAGRERGREPDPGRGPGEPGEPGRGRGRDARRGTALGVGRARARGRAALRPEPLLDRPLAAARGGHDADRPRHRRQAAHPRPQRALLAGPARHRGADPRRRVHAHRPLLAAAHLDGPRHRQDRRRARLGVRRPDPPVPLMLASALLALALVAPQEAPLPPPSAPAEEFVRAVRVEAAPKEGLEPFVGLVPGRPLDREAVRRAVELMFATGRFEDVLVELRRQEGEDGVEVVFRPAPPRSSWPCASRATA